MVGGGGGGVVKLKIVLLSSGKGSTLKGKNLLLRGANSKGSIVLFYRGPNPFRVHSFSEGTKNNFWTHFQGGQLPK